MTLDLLPIWAGITAAIFLGEVGMCKATHLIDRLSGRK